MKCTLVYEEMLFLCLEVMEDVYSRHPLHHHTLCAGTSTMWVMLGSIDDHFSEQLFFVSYTTSILCCIHLGYEGRIGVQFVTTFHILRVRWFLQRNAVAFGIDSEQFFVFIAFNRRHCVRNTNVHNWMIGSR